MTISDGWHKLPVSPNSLTFDPAKMASQDSSEHSREPITPAARKRLQKCFEFATKQAQQENYDYASELFTQCVLGEPGNPTYIQNFVGNLQKKYSNNKKGSPLAQFKERGARSALKKALAQSDWDEVIKNGVVILKINPWDIPTLTGMATASAALMAEEGGASAGYADCELFYLKCAVEASPKDPEVCRQLAIALGKRQRFDEAIAFWHKVEQARPGDEEAQRAIATLAVEKDHRPRKVGRKRRYEETANGPPGRSGRGRTHPGRPAQTQGRTPAQGCGLDTMNWPNSTSMPIVSRTPWRSTTRRSWCSITIRS